MKGGRLHDSLGNDDYHWRRRPWYDGYAFYFVCRFCQVGKTAGHRDVLSDMLPAAVMGLLVVYSLKDVSLSVAPNGIPEPLLW